MNQFIRCSFLLVYVTISLNLVNCSTNKKTVFKERQLEFSTLYKGFYCTQNKRENNIITDSKALEAFWNKTFAKEFPIRDLPRIDFSKQMLIACFNGEFNSGGHSIEITKITKSKRSIQINVDITRPGTKCATSAAFTQPYHIILVDLFETNIDFVDSTTTTVCN